MKTYRFLVSLCLLGLTLAGAEDGAKYAPEMRTVTETFSTTVLKVYSVQEGDLGYAAYVVDWKGHEVVVTASSREAGETDYKVGDTIHCTMQQTNQHLGAKHLSRVIFVATNVLSGPEEAARLEEVAAEVKERRERRQAAMGRGPKVADNEEDLGSVRPSLARVQTVRPKIEIQLRAGGDAVVDKVVVGDEALAEKLKAIAKQSKRSEVNLIANEKTPVAAVAKIMEQCRKLGLQNISLQTGGAE